MMKNILDNRLTPDDKSLNEKPIKYDEVSKNNSFNDITGNMTTWRVHETYIGSGNAELFEKLNKNQNKEKN